MTIAAILMDFASLEFATKEGADAATEIVERLVAYDKKQRERLKKLQALEAGGVDNWEGYDEVMRELHNAEEDDEDHEAD